MAAPAVQGGGECGSSRQNPTLVGCRRFLRTGMLAGLMLRTSASFLIVLVSVMSARAQNNFFDRWEARTSATQAKQPAWTPPLATTYVGLIQVYRGLGGGWQIRLGPPVDQRGVLSRLPPPLEEIPRPAPMQIPPAIDKPGVEPLPAPAPAAAPAVPPGVNPAVPPAANPAPPAAAAAPAATPPAATPPAAAPAAPGPQL